LRDILDQITKWWDSGETFGLATVVNTFRSAPRDPGAALAVSDHVSAGFAKSVHMARGVGRLRSRGRRLALQCEPHHGEHDPGC